MPFLERVWTYAVIDTISAIVIKTDGVNLKENRCILYPRLKAAQVVQ